MKPNPTKWSYGPLLVTSRGSTLHAWVETCSNSAFRSNPGDADPFSKTSWRSYMCHDQKSRFYWGMGILRPLIGNPYNGYINPYGLGLMSLSPIIWKCHGSWSTLAHMKKIDISPAGQELLFLRQSVSKRATKITRGPLLSIESWLFNEGILLISGFMKQSNHITKGRKFHLPTYTLNKQPKKLVPTIFQNGCFQK